jgi:hypothetical protein
VIDNTAVIAAAEKIAREWDLYGCVSEIDIVKLLIAVEQRKKQMDSDGYPDEEELERIAKWPVSDVEGLVEFIKDLWWHPELVRRSGPYNEHVELVTGGWSGNEDIIRALHSNYVFYGVCWELSRRGGYHLYDLSRLIFANSAKKLKEE